MLTYGVYDYTYSVDGYLTSKTNTLTSQVTSYVYDVFGNLTQVTLPSSDVITYEVDGLNRRISKAVNGNIVKKWVYMDQYRIAAELDGTGVMTKRFIYGSKGNIPDYMIASGIKYRIISDHLGSPRLVVRQSNGSVIQRMNHDEFGRIVEDTNPGYLPFGFAGGIYDNQTGLVRFGARDYDSITGRWTSKDPILFNGGDTNLFGYVANDPVNWTDPSGLCPWCIVGGVVAGLLYSTDTDTPGAAQSEMIGVPLAVAGGYAAGLAATSKYSIRGGELVITRGGQQTRINPTGDANSCQPGGKLPHYHRSTPDPMNPGQSTPGQGIGRHRPWDVRSTDRSFWDRF